MRRVTLFEAKVKLAKLMAEQEAKRKLWVDAEASKKDEAKGAWEIAKYQTHSYLDELATDPEIRQNMAPWMIDFHGHEQPGWAREGRQPTLGDISATLDLKGSSLGKIVQDWLSEHDFHPGDRGGGVDGWDLGVLCSDQEASLLCSLAHVELRQYIDAEVLQIKLKFWGWRFKGFDWKEILKLTSS
jgi:hypothetical protein